MKSTDWIEPMSQVEARNLLKQTKAAYIKPSYSRLWMYDKDHEVNIITCAFFKLLTNNKNSHWYNSKQNTDYFIEHYLQYKNSTAVAPLRLKLTCFMVFERTSWPEHIHS